jgi:hypothetical protein
MLIDRVQFSVMQQYERGTWYDIVPLSQACPSDYHVRGGTDDLGDMPRELVAVGISPVVFHRDGRFWYPSGLPQAGLEGSLPLARDRGVSMTKRYG